MYRIFKDLVRVYVFSKKKFQDIDTIFSLVAGSFVAYINVLHRGVEQLVARRAHNPKVAGSNPAPATIES